MAAKRKQNYARIKVWGETMTMECEGTILGCMGEMLMMAPEAFRQRFVDELQARVDALQKKEEEVMHVPEH